MGIKQILRRALGSVACGVALMCAPTAWPQQPVAPPIPPLKPPPAARWSITYQEKDEPGKAPTPLPKPGDVMDNVAGAKKVKLVKEDYLIYGNVSSVTKSYSDGSNEAIYVIDGQAYFSNKNKQVRVETKSKYAGANVKFNEHYPGFDWLQKQYFVDVLEKDGKKFLHYRQGSTKHKDFVEDGVGAGMVYDPNSTAQEREAWVDADSGMPVSFRQGPLFAVYQLEEPPTEKITPPTEFQHAVRSYYGLE